METRTMRPYPLRALRAAGRFVVVAIAMLPVSMVSLQIAMFVPLKGVTDLFTWLFFVPQFAFPQVLEHRDSHAVVEVPGAITVATWVILAILFGSAAANVRGRRAWIIAIGAVFGCVYLGSRLITGSGYHAVLDGP